MDRQRQKAEMERQLKDCTYRVIEDESLYKSIPFLQASHISTQTTELQLVNNVTGTCGLYKQGDENIIIDDSFISTSVETVKELAKNTSEFDIGSYRLLSRDLKIKKIVIPGFDNYPNHCYFNALFQALLHCEYFADFVKATNAVNAANARNRNIESEIFSMLGNIYTLDTSRPYDARKLVKSINEYLRGVRNCSGQFDGNDQCDVDQLLECIYKLSNMNCLFNCITAMINPNLLYTLVYGIMLNNVKEKVNDLGNMLNTYGSFFVSLPKILCLRIYYDLGEHASRKTIVFKKTLYFTLYNEENNTYNIHEYELKSLVMYSGHGSAGHYWSYVKEFNELNQSSEWVNKNDTQRETTRTAKSETHKSQLAEINSNKDVYRLTNIRIMFYELTKIYTNKILTKLDIKQNTRGKGVITTLVFKDESPTSSSKSSSGASSSFNDNDWEFVNEVKTSSTKGSNKTTSTKGSNKTTSSTKGSYNNNINDEFYNAEEPVETTAATTTAATTTAASSTTSTHGSWNSQYNKSGLQSTNKTNKVTGRGRGTKFTQNSPGPQSTNKTNKVTGRGRGWGFGSVSNRNMGSGSKGRDSNRKNSSGFSSLAEKIFFTGRGRFT